MSNVRNEYNHLYADSTEPGTIVLNITWGWNVEVDEEHSYASAFHHSMRQVDSHSRAVVKLHFYREPQYEGRKMPETAEFTDFMKPMKKLDANPYWWKAEFDISPDLLHSCLEYDGKSSLTNNRYHVKVTLKDQSRPPYVPLAPPSFILNQEYLYDLSVSDAIIVVKSTSGTVDLPVSKLLLSNASEVFYRMFCSGFAESEFKPLIRIDGISEAAVRAMIEFASTNTMITELGSVELRKEVYDLSERYEMNNLALVAAGMIVKEDLNSESVFNLLDFAEKYSNKCLFDACFAFLKDNGASLNEETLFQALIAGGNGVKRALAKLSKSSLIV
ncbi:hypothetical protein SeMB42_g07929 [Synchytrium endobioticum]|uniref:BTB domain-containing protein n=1 Tax=Synchytrium endobioticum TaxID=286115 RepID=A0A507BTA8_9FUNG|nr:hypothetical protein SeMB42_g07929 [Synchytrium endobioticum]TPX33292.1 hypothetical protein SeLEV6574_g08386 [Synchytrium endobioticum]